MDRSDVADYLRRHIGTVYEERRINMIPQDPAMLLSFINLKLRDYYSNLDKLCDDLDIDRAVIEDKLSIIDYHYDEEKNQFV